MSLFLRCSHVGGRGTIRTKQCGPDCTYHYQFKEPFGGPLMAKYGEKYGTFRKVQQGDTGHWNKAAAETHEQNLRKDMRLIKDGESPIGPLKMKVAMAEATVKLSALVTRYVEWMAAGNIAETTAPPAATACRNLMAFLGGDTIIGTITADHLEQWKSHRMNTPKRDGTARQASSINTGLGYIQGMFRQAEIFFKGFSSPFTPVIIAGEKRCPVAQLDVEDKIKRVPTAEEYAAIIARLPEPLDLIAQTQFETSKRIGEVVALKAGSVGLNADGESGWFKCKLKGGKTAESDLSKDLVVRLLARLKANGPGSHYFFPHHQNPLRHVRPGTVGTALGVWFKANGYVDEEGKNWMKSHRFRHMAIRSMLDRRIPEHDIIKLTGHTSTKQIPLYAGDRTAATKVIGREQAELHQLMMKKAPKDAVKVPISYSKRKTQPAAVLPFKKKGVA